MGMFLNNYNFTEMQVCKCINVIQSENGTFTCAKKQFRYKKKLYINLQ